MSQFLEKFRMAGGDADGVMERFMDDEELFRECLQQFVDEDDFAKLQVVFGERDYKQAFDISHSLKGVTGNLGITDTYTKLCKFVDSLRNERYDELEEQLEAVMAAKSVFLEKYKDMV